MSSGKRIAMPGTPRWIAKSGSYEERKVGVDGGFFLLLSALPHFCSSDLRELKALK
jgi:hypothetical protein